MLHLAFRFDAVATAATGALVLLAAGPLEGLLGLPAALLRWAGVILLPYAAVVGSLAMRARIPARAALAVIGCNAAWVVASLLLLVSGRVDPTPLGTAFVVAQALAVAGLASWQYLGLDRR
jgi:hypothetical protein